MKPITFGRVDVVHGEHSVYHLLMNSLDLGPARYAADSIGPLSIFSRCLYAAPL